MKTAYKQPKVEVLDGNMNGFSFLPASIMEYFKNQKKDIPMDNQKTANNQEIGNIEKSTVLGTNLHGTVKNSFNTTDKNAEYFLKNIEGLNITINRLIDIIEKRL